MADRPPRRGRRDNGLEASEYAVAADVDPRIGEHLLDVLALARIAAYLQPTSDLDPVTRSSMLPARPTDRLYVDRAHLDEAREYARRLEAGEDPIADEEAEQGGALDDFEVRWRELVAQLESESGGPNRPDRDAVRGADPGTPTGGRDFRLPRLRSALPDRDGDEPTLLDALDADYDDDDGEGFVPPTPPPLPRMSRPTGYSLAAIAVGLVVLLWPNSLHYLSIRSDQAALVLATCFLVAGCVGLVLQLRAAPDEDEDPDDGARV